MFKIVIRKCLFADHDIHEIQQFINKGSKLIIPKNPSANSTAKLDVFVIYLKVCYILGI